MATFLAIKQIVESYRGKNTYASVDAIRDTAINSFRREIYNRHNFRWSLVKETLTLTSGASDIDINFNPTFGVKLAYDENSNVYTQIDPEQQLDYTSDSDYVFYITYNTSTNKYTLTTPSSAATLYLTYNIIPDDLSGASDVDPCPDPEAIALGAVAKLWMSKERDETNHDRYLMLANQRIDQMIINDKKWTGRKRVKSLGERISDAYTQLKP